MSRGRDESRAPLLKNAKIDHTFNSGACNSMKDTFASNLKGGICKGTEDGCASNISGVKYLTVGLPHNEPVSVKETIPYYLPCVSWMPSYSLNKCMCDLVAGISLASFQIPLAMSYAASVAHIPAVCGLYSLAFCPIIYTLLGSVPQMIVGPESAISLVVGQAIESRIAGDSTINPVDLCVVITFISGLVLLVGGLFRFGFLANVLSRALLKGFISGVGIVMVITSLVVELKLSHVTPNKQEHYHSPIEKLIFIFKYGPENYHKPTALFSLAGFLTLMVLRVAKHKLARKFKGIVLFPEILLIVVISIILSYKLDLESNYGIDILGETAADPITRLKNPFSAKNMANFKDLFSTGFMAAMLGFFESATASKSLGTTYNLAISSNRELIALGSLNSMGSALGILPAFGGYGRSKINAYSGAKTTMSGLFMAILTMITIRFLLPIIHYIPICMLSVITTVVGITLLEEAPHDIRFHWKCKGYSELAVFTLTLGATVLYSLEAGIYMGCGYSIVNVVRHSAKSRIQILGRVAGADIFANADEFQENMVDYLINPQLEEVEGCLIVRIPEPLTFTNADDLKMRLHRLERHGSAKTHPAAPRSRKEEMTRHIIFDIQGMTDIDSSAAQILEETMAVYRHRGVSLYLVGVSLIERVRNRLQDSKILDHVHKKSPSTPFFSTIEEALTAVDDASSDSNLSQSSPPPSILSSTLLNSSL